MKCVAVDWNRCQCESREISAALLGPLLSAFNGPNYLGLCWLSGPPVADSRRTKAFFSLSSSSSSSLGLHEFVHSSIAGNNNDGGRSCTLSTSMKDNEFIFIQNFLIFSFLHFATDSHVFQLLTHY